MKHVHIFTTGGSIDKNYSLTDSDFVVGAPQIDTILRDANVNFSYTIDSLMRKDSLVITDADRALIVERVTQSPHALVLITHGTDTMTLTGIALQQAHLDKVIVLTGALQPASFKVTDAPLNIGTAIGALQILPIGVYIAMNGCVFEAHQTRKNNQTIQFEPLDE